MWQAWCYTGRKPSLTDVGGDGGGTLGCRFSLLGASLRGTRLLQLQHGDLGVKTLSIYGHVTVAPLASCPPWRRRIGSPSRVVAVVAMVGWWRCSCVVADEVRMVRVGGEVQRGHGAGSLGLVCMLRL